MNTSPVLSGRFGQVLTLAGLIGLMAGCNMVSMTQPLHEETRTSNTPHLEKKALDVVTRNGSVTVRREDRDDVQIVAHLKAVSPERLAAVEVVADRDEDGTLSISVDWPEGKPQNREGCRFEIHIPGATGVSVRSSNGKIGLTGLGGDTDLQTSNGSIEVKSHDGPLKAHTSNGQIAASAVQGEIAVSTSNGRIKITDAIGRVDAKTSNGSVDVSLHPEGVGPLKVDTSNGSISLGLSSAVKGQLKLNTSNGSVTIDPSLKSQVVSHGKAKAVLQLGESGNESTAKTSNGSIRVRGRNS